MKKNKNKNLEAKVQALKNQLNLKDNKSRQSENIKLDLSNLIKKDLIQTFILVILSFSILIALHYLDANLFFNKFF